jgi:hypothetical protein
MKWLKRSLMVMVLGFLGVPKLHEFGLMLFVGIKNIFAVFCWELSGMPWRFNWVAKGAW